MCRKEQKCDTKDCKACRLRKCIEAGLNQKIKVKKLVSKLDSTSLKMKISKESSRSPSPELPPLEPETHYCLNNQEVETSEVACKLCSSYRKYLAKKSSIAIKPSEVHVIRVDKESYNNPKPILRKSREKRTKSITWFDGETASVAQSHLAQEITFHSTRRVAAHWTVSSVAHFEKNWQEIYQLSENNSDIRSARKETRFQMSVEKNLGFYRPDKIKADLGNFSRKARK